MARNLISGAQNSSYAPPPFPADVPGTGIFMTARPEGAPPILVHHLTHNKVLHEHVVLLTVATVDVPTVDPREAIDVVKLENGLHLGPSSQIVQMAQKFNSELLIRKGDRTVDGKSMLDLLTLAAEHGTVLELETRGADAAAALEAISALFERNFASDQPTDRPA